MSELGHGQFDRKINLMLTFIMITISNFNVNQSLVKLFSGVLRRRSEPAQGLSLGRGRGVFLHEEGRHGPQDPGGRKIQRSPNQGRRCKTIIFYLKLLVIFGQSLHVFSFKWVVRFQILTVQYLSDWNWFFDLLFKFFGHYKFAVWSLVKFIWLS